jgi:hypothetical protein
MTRVWVSYETVTLLLRATTLPLVILGASGITVLKCSSPIHFDASFPTLGLLERPNGAPRRSENPERRPHTETTDEP